MIKKAIDPKVKDFAHTTLALTLSLAEQERYEEQDELLSFYVEYIKRYALTRKARIVS